MLVGNGCWGGSATSFQCNGPNEKRNEIDFSTEKGWSPGLRTELLMKHVDFRVVEYLMTAVRRR